MKLSRRYAPWLLALFVLLGGCSSDAVVEDDPERAAREAFDELGGSKAVGLTVTLDAQLANVDLPGAELGPEARLLLGGSSLEVRSAVGEPAHVRVVSSGEARDALESAAEQLRVTGLEPIAESLLAEQWVRVSVPSPEDAEGDRLALGISEAGARLLDEADVVAYAGAGRFGDRIRVSAGRDQVRRFVADVAGVVASSERPADGTRAEAADGGSSVDDGAGDVGELATVDVWVAGGELRALVFDLREFGDVAEGEPLLLRVEVQPTADDAGLPSDAPPFALRALVSETLAAADRASPSGNGVAMVESESDPPAEAEVDEGSRAQLDSEASPGEPEPGGQPREPEGDPAPLREGGVLEETFGDDNPFREDAEFDCVTAEDLEILGETLGPEAVEEFEELIELGYLERC